MIRLSSLIARFERFDSARDSLLGVPPGATVRATIADSQEVWVHRGDLVIPEDLDADISLIVMGHLVVDGIYDDYRSAVGKLVVRGSFSARHVRTRGPLHVCGDAMVHGVLYAEYNDYELNVDGATFARCLIVADHACDIHLVEDVPQIDWDEGVRTADITAVFSEAVCQDLLAGATPEPGHWFDIPEWSQIEKLIHCGVPLWRETDGGSKKAAPGC